MFFCFLNSSAISSINFYFAAHGFNYSFCMHMVDWETRHATDFISLGKQETNPYHILTSTNAHSPFIKKKKAQMFIPLGNKACNKPAMIDAYAFRQIFPMLFNNYPFPSVSLKSCINEAHHHNQPLWLDSYPMQDRTCKIHCKRKVFLCISYFFLCFCF